MEKERLRSWSQNRLGIAVLCLLAIAMLVVTLVLLRPAPGVVVATGPLVLACAYIGVRALFLGIVLRPDELTVRGLVRSRTVKKRAITRITDTASIEWTDDQGVPRATMVTAFLAYADGPDADRRRRVVVHLRDWLREDDRDVRRAP